MKDTETIIRPAVTQEELEPKKNDASNDKNTQWRKWRPFAVWGTSLLICILIVVMLFGAVKDMLISPADPKDATPIVVEIPRGSGASTIAKILYEAGGEDGEGLIKHAIGKAAFKIYVDFTGNSSKLKAGTYILSKNMSIPQMVDIICEGNPAKPTVRFTIAEGMTVEDIAKRLVEVSVLDSETEFLNLCKTGSEFKSDYSFINDIPSNITESRKYVLEGYLFPDTYEVYTDATPRTIITKMLDRFAQIFDEDMIARAEELNMTMDEVVRLASVIEKEAKTDDFSKVAAVFFNRMDADMTLQSDAPLNYILGTGDKLSFTNEEMQNTSLYNTHVHKGLPLGAISNPGAAAIKAVLRPYEDYMQPGNKYYYFCLTTHESGTCVFAKTLDEHNANVAQYKPYW
ncbi:MAG: endolytic transglycosylase MltG [Clostridia bacterium]|nr:endolytic transglycosylase MltG [Clostridia bacterium]